MTLRGKKTYIGLVAVLALVAAQFAGLDTTDLASEADRLALLIGELVGIGIAWYGRNDKERRSIDVIE